MRLFHSYLDNFAIYVFVILVYLLKPYKEFSGLLFKSAILFCTGGNAQNACNTDNG